MALLSHFRTAFDSIVSNKSRLGSLPGMILIGVVTFFVGLAISFPDDAVQARLQYELDRNLPAQISIGNAGYSFPFSIVAENATVRLDEPGRPEIKLDTIRLTPHLGSLIGQPGVCFTVAIGPGEISGSVDRSGEIILEIDSLQFDEPLQGFQSLRLSGQINSANLDADLRPDAETPTLLALRASRLKLSGTRNAGLATDQLDFGQLDLQIEGKGRNLMIRKGVLSEGDITAAATGRLALGKTINTTRLNLEVQVKPSTGLDESVSSLFGLLGTPGKDGARKINIRGTLARPDIR